MVGVSIASRMRSPKWILKASSATVQLRVLVHAGTALATAIRLVGRAPTATGSGQRQPRDSWPRGLRDGECRSRPEGNAGLASRQNRASMLARPRLTARSIQKRQLEPARLPNSRTRSHLD
jgi:hypothetical protein